MRNRYVSFDRVDSSFRTGKKSRVDYWVRRFGVCGSPCRSGGRSLLHFAAEYGWNEEIGKWRDAGLIDNVSVKTEGEEPIHFAARRGSAATISELIKAGASLEAETPRGETALLLVPSYRPDVMNFVISKGGSPFAKTKEGETFLHSICQDERVIIDDVLEFAGRYRALMEAEYRGRTPLATAWRMGRLVLCEKLVGLGADVSRLWKGLPKGEDALVELSRGQDRGRAMSFLLDGGVPLDRAEEALEHCASGMKSDMFGVLAKRGVRLSKESADKSWWVVLCSPDEKRVRPMARVLVSNGYYPPTSEEFSISVAKGLIDDKSAVRVVKESPTGAEIKSALFDRVRYFGDDMKGVVSSLIASGEFPSQEEMSSMKKHFSAEVTAEIERMYLKVGGVKVGRASLARGL